MRGSNNNRGVMSRRVFAGGVGVTAAGIVSGCASLTPRNGIASAPLQNRAVISGLPGVRTWGDEIPADLAQALRGHMGRGGLSAPAVARVAFNRSVVEILALSGGGTDGAFGAGLLVGWTKRGDRPEFEIVTGVSAGAIIAPFAYLGPRYDKVLTQIWTEVNVKDLFVSQGLGGILGGIAAVDTAPLAAAIAKYVTPRLMSEIAVQHDRGRLLLVGTTNLDAQRPVVWNLGAIASSGHPDALELMRKVIRASCAVPGLFPPVTIEVEADGKVYEEMHVDGGVTRDVFVAPFPVAYSAFDRFYASPPQRKLFIVTNGKITPEPEVVAPQTLTIAARSIYTLLKSQHQGEIQLIYRRALDSRADFNMASVPDNFRSSSATFGDPDYEKALYDVGFSFWRTGGHWAKHPPVGQTRKL